jgi:hypothetical protein
MRCMCMRVISHPVRAVCDIAPTFSNSASAMGFSAHRKPCVRPWRVARVRVCARGVCIIGVYVCVVRARVRAPHERTR